MNSEPETLSTSSDFLDTLMQAAGPLCRPDYWSLSRDRPAASAVVAALLTAEKTAKQQRLTYPAAALIGQWQLCFTAPRRAHFYQQQAMGRGFYLPRLVPAQISFRRAAIATDAHTDSSFDLLIIGNQVQVGSLQLQLTGPARYLGKKNILAFDFTQWQLCAFGRTLYQGELRGGRAQSEQFANQAIGTLPFFAFFLITEDVIAARGRGGGIALWVRQADPIA
jgi:hypothetical protein